MTSPSIMRAWETGEWDSGPSHPPCDGCGKELHEDTPMLVLEDFTVIICIGCVRWALPQLEWLERDGQEPTDG